MDRNTLIVLLAAIAVVGAGLYWLVGGSVERTRLTTDMQIIRAQEHTRRAEGRHDLIDLLGWVRGKPRQGEDRK